MREFMDDLIRTTVALGPALGVTQQRASKILKDRGLSLPMTAERAKRLRAELDEAKAVNNGTAGDYNDDDVADPIEAIKSLSPERKAKLQLMIERSAKIKVEREMMLGNYMKKEDHERALVERAQAIRAEAGVIPTRAAQLCGKDETEIAAILTQWMRELCNNYAAK